MNNDRSIYACYEEIKQREISELKEKLKAYGGKINFGGINVPCVLVNDDTGPHDAYIHSVSFDDTGNIVIQGIEEACTTMSEIFVNDIAYGHIEFIADQIPGRTFTQESFCISRLSREDLENIGFDTSDVDDKTMQRLAEKLGDDYCEQLFWISLEIIAEEGFDIPRKD
jgi:hypothetical protein